MSKNQTASEKCNALTNGKSIEMQTSLNCFIIFTPVFIPISSYIPDVAIQYLVRVSEYTETQRALDKLTLKPLSFRSDSI